eukprot:CAMPEP_0171699800 /NCGR_PEP_ID=MMETSP0991-20121206/10182_1 /TAXON_ID=483369 /ORGANISM="non described non described, Strain CCMP2098" /LENGTH=152 /DNA_ID=CAMNT_0012288953 /DNA_START=20 /DNA_END=478 /DNA_ORIENTATION=-
MAERWDLEKAREWERAWVPARAEGRGALSAQAMAWQRGPLKGEAWEQLSESEKARELGPALEWRWELVLATERGRGSAFCSAPRLVTASGEATARPTANQMEEKLVKLSALERAIWLGHRRVHKSEGALEPSKAGGGVQRKGAQSAVEWGRV